MGLLRIGHIAGVALILATAAGVGSAAPGDLGQSSAASLSVGVVTDTGEPVYGAQVRLSGGDRQPLLGTTNESGRYTFLDLPLGSYSLSASKPGFLTSYSGSSRPGRGPSIPVSVTNRSERILTLFRGAAISGTLTDLVGQPAGQIPIQVINVRTPSLPGAQETWTLESSTLTRNDGVYRLFGLAPGRYVVVAVPTNRGALSAGGSMRSDSMAVGPAAFPGVMELTAAMRLEIREPGQEIEGIDFSLQPVKVASIAGHVIRPDGRPAVDAIVTISKVSDPISLQSPAPTSGGTPAIKGTGSGDNFSFTNLVPGRYVIAAKAPAPAGDSSTQPLRAELEVTVDAQDISNLRIQIQPGVTVSGRIEFSGTASRSDIRLLASDRRSHRIPGSRPYVAELNRDGTFVLRGVTAGRYDLDVISPSGIWTVDGMFIGSENLSGSVEITGRNDVDDVLIRLTDKPAALSGHLLDVVGRPAAGLSVIVFPTDKAAWGISSKRLRVEAAAEDGSFDIRGLPAGEYFVIAATEVELIDLLESGVLDHLHLQAFRIVLAPGQQVRQDFKVARIYP